MPLIHGVAPLAHALMKDVSQCLSRKRRTFPSSAVQTIPYRIQSSLFKSRGAVVPCFGSSIPGYQKKNDGDDDSSQEFINSRQDEDQLLSIACWQLVDYSAREQCQASMPYRCLPSRQWLNVRWISLPALTLVACHADHQHSSLQYEISASRALALDLSREWAALPAIRLGIYEQATQAIDPTDIETVASDAAVGQQGQATRPGHEAIPSSADNRQEQPSLERFLAGFSPSLQDGPPLAQHNTL
ncbi:hypothetical protein CF319_g6184 [Tilletia indica]|nr:hypothetical protein CF319_g6184 [Tilletia indica]